MHGYHNPWKPNKWPLCTDREHLEQGVELPPTPPLSGVRHTRDLYITHVLGEENHESYCTATDEHKHIRVIVLQQMNRNTSELLYCNRWTQTHQSYCTTTDEHKHIRVIVLQQMNTNTSELLYYNRWTQTHQSYCTTIDEHKHIRVIVLQ